MADARHAPTPMLLAWSGGKDAAWALHVLRHDPTVQVVGLLTTITAEYERVAMQGIRVEVLRAQAEAVDLPLIESRMPRDADNDTYLASFAAALAEARARWPGLDRVAFGDLFLADVRAWRESVCESLGWTPHFPLFGLDTAALARTMLEGGLRAHLCCVDTQQLDARFAGRSFDATLLDALPSDVDPCGERGEFHTCVYAAPVFRHPLVLEAGTTVLREARFAYTDWLLQVPDATPAG